MGGAWLCAQLWDHWQFSGDAALPQRIYPLMRGAAEFLLDYLVAEPGTEYLVTNPSLSPENQHPFGTSLCAGPAMDNQIIRDLFGGLIEAGRKLGVDAECGGRLTESLKRLRPDQIGRGGQLQEWASDWDLDVPEPHHRHVSHLYGLYPSLQVNFEETPDLAAAARRSLELRDDDATGWGIGWRLNLWARLGDAERADAVLARLLSPMALSTASRLAFRIGRPLRTAIPSRRQGQPGPRRQRSSPAAAGHPEASWALAKRSSSLSVQSEPRRPISDILPIAVVAAFVQHRGGDGWPEARRHLDGKGPPLSAWGPPEVQCWWGGAWNEGQAGLMGGFMSRDDIR